MVFDQALPSDGAKIRYESRWVDPDSGQVYPGTLRLKLPFNQVTEAFVLKHDFLSQFLILTIRVEGDTNGERVIQHIGPYDDDGEYLWDSEKAMDLPVSIQCISLDLVTRPAPETPPVENKPHAWQVDMLKSVRLDLQAQSAATQALQKEVRRIGVLLVFIAFGILLGAIAKGI